MSSYYHQPLEYDRYFHIYNRSLNCEKIFQDQQNCQLFLDRFKEYIEPVAETFAWCLIINHFHVLVRIKRENEIDFIKQKPNDNRKFTSKKKYNPTRQFSHLFNSFSKSYNYQYNRIGTLFETPFRRIMVEDENYLKQVVCYIHNNPIKHKVVDNLLDYRWSSYSSLISDKPTLLKRECVIEWFGSDHQLIEYHKFYKEISEIKKYSLEMD